MKTRSEMVYALTKYELEYLIDNPEWLEDTTKYFADGGVNTKTDAELFSLCKIKHVLGLGDV